MKKLLPFLAFVAVGSLGFKLAMDRQKRIGEQPATNLFAGPFQPLPPGGGVLLAHGLEQSHPNTAGTT